MVKISAIFLGVLVIICELKIELLELLELLEWPLEIIARQNEVKL